MRRCVLISRKESNSKPMERKMAKKLKDMMMKK